MILLRRLQAHNFKQLQNVDLHLPDSGTVLIEGHNEAGKSSLFEATFFALFGRAPAAETNIADLKRYGTDSTEVALDFSIAGRDFSIRRTLGKAHRAKLVVQKIDGEETISSLTDIRRRLADEMRLSSDALLNTCFVEQKRLERLEDMNAESRRNAINELLNLKVLSDLESHFKITREMRDEIERQRAHVAIAELDAVRPALEYAVRCAEYSFMVAQRQELSSRLVLLQQRMATAEREQKAVEAERAAIAEKIQTIEQLKARGTAIDGELTWRLKAWEDADKANSQVLQRLHELEEHAKVLPQREAELNEQKALLRQLAELNVAEQEAAQWREYWPLLQAAREEYNLAREEVHECSHAVASNTPPMLPVLAALLVSVVTLVAGYRLGLFLYLAIIIAILWAIVATYLLLDRQKFLKVAREAKDVSVQKLAAAEGSLRALELHRPAVLPNKNDAEIAAMEKAFSSLAAERQRVITELNTRKWPTDLEALKASATIAEDAIEREQVAIAELPTQRQTVDEASAALEKAVGDFGEAWRKFNEEVMAAVTVAQAQEILTQARRRIEESRNELQANSEDSDIFLRDAQLQQKYSELDRELATLKHQVDEQQTQLTELSESPNEADCITPEKKLDVEQVQEILRERRESLLHHDARRRAAAEQIGVSDEAIDLANAKSTLAELEQRVAVRRRASEIVSKTRADIVSRVMPLTIANVRRVLPLLTEGRYRDVQWEEESNLLSVYDMQARDFVRKRVFSGGARDQISLALRLAFALATLPGEHNIRPGFLFLDEPLSSFDRARTQALVDLLTRGLIRQSFRQIFLVSHSESFDPALFDFRLQMEEGRVVESTIP